MEQLTFAASSGLALVLTNLDNTAVLFALLVPLGTKRAIAGFVTAQAIVLGAALAVAFGMSDVLSHYSGYLGVLPVLLGAYGLFQSLTVKHVGEAGDRPGLVHSAPAAVLLFLSMSMDTFAIMMPLLTDSLPGYRMSGMFGAVCAIALIAAAALMFAPAAARTGPWLRRAEILGPCIMILSGLYVLSDSGTDLL